MTSTARNGTGAHWPSTRHGPAKSVLPSVEAAADAVATAAEGEAAAGADTVVAGAVAAEARVVLAARGATAAEAVGTAGKSRHQTTSINSECPSRERRAFFFPRSGHRTATRDFTKTLASYLGSHCPRGCEGFHDHSFTAGRQASARVRM